MSVPLSVLDLATVPEGKTSADALRGTLDIARAADRAGFRRFWVAEHHNMPAVASTSPPVLISAVAGVTAHLRVGSGGVMLPNHAGYVVAEQFAMLEALYPGRIDLGVGRAPGTDQRTALALRRVPVDVEQEFPGELLQVMAWLGDVRVERPLADHLAATPVPSGGPEIWLLGSSGYAAQLAGALGLPYCYAHHFGGLDPVQVLDAYRARFEPSPCLDEPHAMVCTSAIAADTAEEAAFLAGPARVMALALRTGRLGPVVSPETAAARVFSPAEEQALGQLPATKFVGSTDEVVAGLRSLVAASGAAELMLTATTFDPQTKIDSLTRIAAAWGEPPR